MNSDRVKSRFSLKERMSSRYVDWIEILPKFNGGLFRELQQLRSRQRDDAKKAFDNSRPPEGIEISFNQLLMIELFLVEDSDRLDRELRRLFSNGPRKDELIRSVSDRAATLFAGGWSFIGHITRDKVNAFFYPAGVTTMPELPTEVSRISVTLAKILPSVLAISFCVDLNQEATKQLNSLLNRIYMPQFSFGGLLPTRRNLSRWSDSGSERVMRHAVADYMASIRIRIERALRKRFRGVFFQMPVGSDPQLPAVESLTIHGVTSEDAASSLQQLKPARHWLDAVGFASWRDDLCFSDANGVFQWPDEGFIEEDENRPYKLFSFRCGDSRTDEPSHLRPKLSQLEHALTSAVGTLAIVERLRRQVETLRVMVYRTLASGNLTKRLRREMHLNNKMQLNRMIVSRLDFETKNSRPMIMRMPELMSFQPRSKNDLRALGTVFLDGTENRLKTVFGHCEMVSDQLSSYLERRNLDVAFRLQRKLLWWTVAVTLATIYGIVQNWPKVEYAVGWFHHLLTKLSFGIL